MFYYHMQRPALNFLWNSIDMSITIEKFTSHQAPGSQTPPNQVTEKDKKDKAKEEKV